MELPPLLREGVDRILDGVSVGDIRNAAERLSGRYRGEVRDGRFHLSDSLATSAYLATRLPATYAAIRASLSAVAEIRPGWEPQTLLDIGAGPGSVFWAACDQWPSIEHATMIEGCDPIRRVGEQLAQRAEPRQTAWIAADIQRGLPTLESADLVTLSYVLGELAPDAIARLTERLWAAVTRCPAGGGARNARRLAAHPAGQGSPDRARRAHRRAVHPCRTMPACRAGLVSFLAPGRALAPAPARQGRRRAVGG